MCDKLNNSSILVAGNANRRLHALKADDSFHRLPVGGIGESPACAGMYNAGDSIKLYVLCWIGTC